MLVGPDALLAGLARTGLETALGCGDDRASGSVFGFDEAIISL